MYKIEKKENGYTMLCYTHTHTHTDFSRGSVVNIPLSTRQGVGSNLAQIANDCSLLGSGYCP